MIPLSYPSPRVSQLDAHILDSELFSLLKEHLVSIFNLHNNKWWTYDQHSALWDLILNIVIFRSTVWKNGSSYGLSLQNLKYVNSKNGKIINYSKRRILLALVVGNYLIGKLESFLYTTDDLDNWMISGRIKDIIIKYKDIVLARANSLFKVLNLVNFLLFLINGRYSTLVHRALGISLTPIVSDLLKFNGDNVNYEFQNRQLVWNVMTEFLVFIVPLLQLKKLAKMSQKLLSPYKTSESKKSPYENLGISQCAVCVYNKERSAISGDKKIASVSSNITNPYITSCGHIYCYICATSLLGADSFEGSGCLRCSMKIEWIKKYNDIDSDCILVDYDEISDEEIEEQDEHKVEAIENDTNSDDNDEEESESDIEEFDQVFDSMEEFDDEFDEIM